MKNYIVYTNGKVLNDKLTNYVVSANNKEEAEMKAKQKFISEFPVLDNNVHIELEERNRFLMCISYALLSISILLSFIGWKTGHETVSIAPNFISTLYAVFFYAAYIIRFKGLKEIFCSWYDLIYCVLILLFVSSLIRCVLVTSEINLLWIFNIKIDTNLILICGLVLSWLGVKIVSTVCFIIVGLFAVLSTIKLNVAMGNLWGTVYVISSFVGLCMYLANDPDLMLMTKALKSTVNNSLNYVQSDYLIAKNNINQYKDKMNNKSIE